MEKLITKEMVRNFSISLGLVALEYASFDEAERYLQDSLQLARRINIPWSLGDSLLAWKVLSAKKSN